MLTPKSAAFFALPPASTPTIIKSVLFDRDPDTLAPMDSALALASPRVKDAKVPVNTMDFQKFGNFDGLVQHIFLC